MSRTTSAANGGRIAAELRNWARGCHSTEAAVELLIRTRGGRFVILDSHGHGPTTEEPPGSTRKSSRGTRMPCPQESATFWHSSRPSHSAPRSKMSAVSWPAWTSTISVSSVPCCGMPALAAGRHLFLTRHRRRVLVMTDDGPDRFRCLIRGPDSRRGKLHRSSPAGPSRLIGCLPRSSPRFDRM